MLAPLESYESEMVEWSEIVEREMGHLDSISVLDLGTGGGHHLYHLAQQLPPVTDGVAVDLSAEMLQHVTSLVSGFECVKSDMTRLRLDREFQFVSVHDSFCYLNSIEAVEALFDTIACHLAPGGMALVKLDAVADSFDGPYRYLTTFEQDDFEVTLTHYEWDPVKSDDWLETIYMFLERSGSEVVTREERHRLGLFYKSRLLESAAKSGFTAEFLELERWDEERENLLLKLRR